MDIPEKPDYIEPYIYHLWVCWCGDELYNVSDFLRGVIFDRDMQPAWGEINKRKQARINYYNEFCDTSECLRFNDVVHDYYGIAKNAQQAYEWRDLENLFRAFLEIYSFLHIYDKQEYTGNTVIEKCDALIIAAEQLQRAIDDFYSMPFDMSQIVGAARIELSREDELKFREKGGFSLPEKLRFHKRQAEIMKAYASDMGGRYLNDRYPARVLLWHFSRTYGAYLYGAVSRFITKMTGSDVEKQDIVNIAKTTNFEYMKDFKLYGGSRKAFIDSLMGGYQK